MNTEERDIDLIEKSLRGLLSESEQQLFDQRWEDQRFRLLYDQESQIADEIQKMGRSRLKESLIIYEKEMPNISERPRRWLNHKWILAAASIVILTMFVLKYLNMDRSSGWFEAYYQPMANVVDPINKSESSNSSGFQLYEQGDYVQAAQILKEAEQSPERDIYLALSYLASSQLDRASQHFIPIIENKNHPYHQEAQWYLALTYIKAKKINLGKMQLEAIAEQASHFYQSRAQTLLTEFN